MSGFFNTASFHHCKETGKQKKTCTAILLLVCITAFSSSVFAFQDPPLITITKPTGGDVFTVCSSGCDFTDLDQANSSADVGPGDTIRVGGGSYDPFNWTKSGNAGDEIVIEPSGDGNVDFQPAGSDICRINGDHVIFDGGEKRQMGIDGDGVADGNYVLRIAGSYVTLHRLHMYDAGLDAHGANGGQFNIGTEGNYVRINNCTIENGFSGGIYVYGGSYTEIRNNIVCGNNGAGIQVNPHGDAGAGKVDGDEIVISGNAVYGNGIMHEKPGIAFLSSDGNHLYDIYIFNNLVWDNHTGIKRSANSDQSNINGRVFNNSIFGSITYNLLIQNGGNSEIRNNNTSGVGWADRFEGTYVESNNVTDPLYASTNEDDNGFLKPTAKNIGYNTTTAIPFFIDDYNGNARDSSAIDIGAFRFQIEPPDNITVELTSTETGVDVTLTWDASLFDGVEGCILYYDTDSGPPYANSIDIPDTGVITQKISGLAEGQPYYFALTTYDSNGWESNYSEEIVIQDQPAHHDEGSGSSGCFISALCNSLVGVFEMVE